MKKVWRVYGIRQMEHQLVDYIIDGDLFHKLKDFDHYDDAEYYMRDTCPYTDYVEFTIKEIYTL